MAIELDAQQYTADEYALKRKCDRLSDLITPLTSCCPICWVWKGRTVPRTKLHRIFVDCRTLSDAKFIPNAVGWWALKRKLSTKLMSQTREWYCYYCGLPTRRLREGCHIAESGKECPFDDFVIVIFWFIFLDKPLWQRIRDLFRVPETEDTDLLAEWMATHDDIGNFYNALELVLWYLDTDIAHGQLS